MKKPILRTLITIASLGIIAANARAGTITYVPVPAQQSDANSGISNQNTYTSAVDGGNATGTDRTVNGVPLVSLSGSGASLTAGNVTVNALSGSLVAAAASTDVPADGVFGDVMKDLLVNDDATDGSQQEIVLDPASLTAGKTYDLRLYICNASDQTRPVNVSFFTDGDGAVSTGDFDEDDATTSAGGFTDKNQVYVINYHYTWDGKTTPGIIISQKTGANGFLFFALTNQEAGDNSAPAPVQQTGPAPQLTVGTPIDASAGGGGGTDVGVVSGDFENCDCMNNNGVWISIGGRRCWHPTHVDVGWRPYTRGHWCHSNCGWTWVCDEQEDQWGWACYHYGRWCQESSVGWCWVPGRVWGPAWVSWRACGGQYGGGGDYNCTGWAPLPPDASCDSGVGISTWVDAKCDIGPECYNFCRTEDMGCANMSTVIFASSQNSSWCQKTVNITNIYNNNTNIYCGGPDVKYTNGCISRGGGSMIATDVVVNRHTSYGLGGGKWSSMQGNTYNVAGPKVTAWNTSKLPPVSKTIDHPKYNSGWGNIDPKTTAGVKTKMYGGNTNKTSWNKKATLPTGVYATGPKVIGGGGITANGTPGYSGGGSGKTGPSGKPSGTPWAKHPGLMTGNSNSYPGKSPTPGGWTGGKTSADPNATPLHPGTTWGSNTGGKGKTTPGATPWGGGGTVGKASPGSTPWGGGGKVGKTSPSATPWGQASPGGTPWSGYGGQTPKPGSSATPWGGGGKVGKASPGSTPWGGGTGGTTGQLPTPKPKATPFKMGPNTGIAGPSSSPAKSPKPTGTSTPTINPKLVGGTATPVKTPKSGKGGKSPTPGNTGFVQPTPSGPTPTPRTGTGKKGKGGGTSTTTSQVTPNPTPKAQNKQEIRPQFKPTPPPHTPPPHTPPPHTPPPSTPPPRTPPQIKETIARTPSPRTPPPTRPNQPTGPRPGTGGGGKGKGSPTPTPH